MSTRTAAILSLDLPPTPKFVLVVIEAHTDAAGEAALSGDVLAAQSGLARETVSRAIVFLEKAGLLRVDRQPTAVNLYRVTLPDGGAATPLRSHLPSQRAAPLAHPRAAPHRPSFVTPTPQQAEVWHAFDRLCGPLSENASVQWQRIRLKCCQRCLEAGITVEELEAAARALGLQPGYGAGEQALIAEALEARGEKPPQAYGRPVFKRPDIVEKASEGMRMFREARNAGN